MDLVNHWMRWRRQERESFQANLISDEKWMEMLKIRNELAHDYDGDIVKEHGNEIVENYIDLFYAFEKQFMYYFVWLLSSASSQNHRYHLARIPQNRLRRQYIFYRKDSQASIK